MQCMKLSQSSHHRAEIAFPAPESTPRTSIQLRYEYNYIPSEYFILQVNAYSETFKIMKVSL